MARTLLVVPTAAGVGVGRTCLGVVRALDRRGVKIGFVKPVAQPQADGGPDRSTALVAATTTLRPPDPLSTARLEHQLGAGGLDAVLEAIVATWQPVPDRSDVVVVEGLSPGPARLYASGLNQALAQALDADVLLVGSWPGESEPNSVEGAVDGVTEAFGIEPRVAMISFSTGTSGAGRDVDNVAEATRIVREREPDLAVDGPLQYDAAAIASVGQSKRPGSAVAGRATVFIFPDLDTGNTTYKAVSAQRPRGERRPYAAGPGQAGERSEPRCFGGRHHLHHCPDCNSVPSMSPPTDPYYRRDLALVHDRGFAFHAAACAPGMLKLLEPVRERAGLVVEIGCGSGLLTKELVGAGHRVVATDASPAMLDLAREQVAGAEDIRRVVLPDDTIPAADAIVGVGHALNYLPDAAAIDRALESIAGALLPGGLLAIDICDLEWGRVRQNADNLGRVADDWAIITRFSTPSPDRFVREMTTFVRGDDGSWRRDDERHDNVLVDINHVEAVLVRQGLDVDIRDSFGDERLPAGLRAVLGRRR